MAKNWEQEATITLTKSQWLEVVLGLWDKIDKIKNSDATEGTKEFWVSEVRSIQEKIRSTIDN